MTTAFISSGIVSSGIIVTGGNTLEIQSGGTASATSVESGGTEQVDFGGAADGAIISHGGVAEIYGSDTAAQVHGILDVFSGGFASGDTVRNGGVMGVASSGFASATTVLSDGLLFINSGGSVSGVIVSAGGSALVTAGGVASGTLVASGGVEQVFGSDIAAQVSGVLEVLSGGSASGDTIYAGLLLVDSGGTASGTVMSGGTVELAAGASAGGAITFATSGGTLQIDGRTMPSDVISGLQQGTELILPMWRSCPVPLRRSCLGVYCASRREGINTISTSRPNPTIRGQLSMWSLPAAAPRSMSPASRPELIFAHPPARRWLRLSNRAIM